MELSPAIHGTLDHIFGTLFLADLKKKFSTRNKGTQLLCDLGSRKCGLYAIGLYAIGLYAIGLYVVGLYAIGLCYIRSFCIL